MDRYGAGVSQNSALHVLRSDLSFRIASSIESHAGWSLHSIQVIHWTTKAAASAAVHSKMLQCVAVIVLAL